MKKTVNVAKKASPRKKTTQKMGKKAVKPVKTPAKRRKIEYSDPIKAFLLTGALIALSALISTAVILTRSAVPEVDPPSYVKAEPEPQKPAPEQPPSSAANAVPDAANTPPVTRINPEAANKTPEASTTPAAVNTIPVTRKTPAATNTAPVTRATPADVKTIPAARTTTSAANTVSSAAPEKPPANLGTVVFMIDDAGNNLRELEPFLRISGPLTIAVLPGLPNSAEAARRIRAAGKEVFLHQPMEAIGAQNPGPGAIYSGMSAEEIRLILKRNVAEVGPVAGINNHQGSKITMDRDAVETILAFCAENNLRFLDSRTTAETVVPAAARNLGIKIGERDVFLDNEQDKDAMLRSISGGLARAQKNGKAVMIGHTWSPDLAPLLAEQFPLLTKQGYAIKTASDVIK
jgi:polysaccharide deacetylase 2 family uncharacterized protein YibQ